MFHKKMSELLADPDEYEKEKNTTYGIWED